MNSSHEPHEHHNLFSQIIHNIKEQLPIPHSTTKSSTRTPEKSKHEAEGEVDHEEEHIPQDPPTMKAIFLEKVGEPLVIKQVPIPKLCSGQLLIKIEAAPINPSDLGFLNGVDPSKLESSSTIQLGFEGAGTAVSSGGGLIAKSMVGKRVAFAAVQQPGTWAEYAVCDTSSCFPLDKRISFDLGACAIVNPFTALALVNVVKAEKHQAVVQTSAGSSLGRMLTKLFKKEGIKTINIVKQEEHRKILSEIGADIVMNSHDANFDEDLRKHIEEMKATCCLECVCGEVTHKVLKTLPPKSSCYIYGLLADDQLSALDMSEFLLHSKTIKAFNTLDWLHEQGFFRKLGLIKKVEGMIKSDTNMDISKSFSFEEVNEALKYFKEDMSRGKVLLKPYIYHDEEEAHVMDLHKDPTQV